MSEVIFKIINERIEELIKLRRVIRNTLQKHQGEHTKDTVDKVNANLNTLNTALNVPVPQNALKYRAQLAELTVIDNEPISIRDYLMVNGKDSYDYLSHAERAVIGKRLARLLRNKGKEPDYVGKTFVYPRKMVAAVVNAYVADKSH